MVPKSNAHTFGVLSISHWKNLNKKPIKIQVAQTMLGS